MAEVSKAFVVGGFSEDVDFISGFANEISEGPNALVDDVEALTWAQANSRLDDFSKESENRIVFGHSAASMLMQRAEIAVVMSGAEPTPLWKSARGALEVGTNSEIGHDDHVVKTGLSNGFKEVAKHPSTLQIPFRLRKFSSRRMLADGGAEAFPGGRYYLPAQDDEFGFGSVADVQAAKEAGVVAEYVGRGHNYSMLHPRATAGRIKHLVEANS